MPGAQTRSDVLFAQRSLPSLKTEEVKGQAACQSPEAIGSRWKWDVSCGLRGCEPSWPLQFRWERCSYPAKRSGQNSVADWLQRALSGLAPLASVICAVSVWLPPALGNTGPLCLGREAGAVFRSGGHPGCWVCRLAGPSAEVPHLHPNTHRVPGSSKPNSKLGSAWLVHLL